MLRRLDVRTRLVAVITVPLVLVLAMVVPEALERRQRAAEASEADAITTAVDDVAAAADAIQGERTLSAAVRAGSGPGIARALDDQRAITDPAVDRAMGALAALAGEHTELRPSATAATTQLGHLDQIRSETDTAESEVPWNDPFERAIAALLVVQEDAASVTAELGVGEGLSSVALVARMKEATASQAAQMAAATTWGELRGDQTRILTDLRADEAAYRVAYLTTSPSTVRDERRDELLTFEGTAAGRVIDRAMAGSAVGSLASWLTVSDARQQVLREVEAERATGARTTAQLVESTSTRASEGYLLLAGGSLLLALVLALAVARSITRPLTELNAAADRLAQERLPQLVDSLRNPIDDDEQYLSAAMEPIAVTSGDELGQLAEAFNAVQSVAVDVAAEQASLLKKGISELYVNLARRNQALLERQIELLDALEREEEDAKVLEHLYLLDHLATRMRRNAESLLVLAGAESGSRRSAAVPVVDAVRAAVSEVEEYERVDLGDLTEATLHGPAVSDVAHLVAELLENATQFSPPESRVRVDGARTGGSYQLLISDRGLGLRPEQLEELNAVLSDPPVTGLALGRSLGCLVAARLAARHGITVRLRAGEGGGVAAHVILPRQLLVEARTEPPMDPPVTRTAPWERRAPSQEDAYPERLEQALPATDFDAGLQALLEEEDDPTEESTVEATPAPGPTSSTLTRRIPGATTEARAEPLVEAPVHRSPEHVRDLLSRYRSGLEAGRGSDGPPDEERT
jgi:HAMP domain-containing protein